MGTSRTASRSGVRRQFYRRNHPRSVRDDHRKPSEVRANARTCTASTTLARRPTARHPRDTTERRRAPSIGRSAPREGGNQPVEHGPNRRATGVRSPRIVHRTTQTPAAKQLESDLQAGSQGGGWRASGGPPWGSFQPSHRPSGSPGDADLFARLVSFFSASSSLGFS